ncbi:MarR family transcriptional regulator [Kocuria sp. JC486]|uniref:MarR family transcriptional regulator n=1 Tax=Kocuria soli TaxID=2485125 RepID=A0A3N4A1N4_9MICC|nr:MULTISPECIES: MarR family transcriptional regulator [Kocuria]NHU85450.1 MarR family transcriptional regulator [Kocuria sp. JC486]ROZ62176.1 MarR family transcriptional regulator [Kocuria soli]
MNDTTSGPGAGDPIDEARRNWEQRGWKDAAPGMATVTAIFRAHQILLTRIDQALRPHGLTFSRYELLALLQFTRSGALPMSKASARLQVHPTSVTNAVDRLEAAGLVRRVADPNDGRGRLVEITDAGRDLVSAVTPGLNAVFEDVGMSPADLEAVYSALKTFRHSAGDFGE